MSSEELHNIFKDGENNGKIDYTEFLAVSIDQKSFVFKEKIISAFKYFDVDSNGEIDSKDLNKVLLKLGKHILNAEELEKMILEINHNKEKISLQEFLSFFDLK